jgi:DNA-directed RNA polymerase specialized sigma24 family protein
VPLKNVKPMGARVPTHPSTTFLVELPRLRAYARLMMNDKAKADQMVVDTIEGAFANDAWFDRSLLRLPVFAMMHKRLLRDHQGSRNGLQPIAGGSLRTTSGSGQALAELPAALVHLHFDERNALVLTVCVRFSDAETAGICECEPELVRRRRLSGIARIVELCEGPS